MYYSLTIMNIFWVLLMLARIRWGGGGGGEWEGVWNPHPENSNLLNSHSKYTENRPRIPKQKHFLGPPGK